MGSLINFLFEKRLKSRLRDSGIFGSFCDNFPTLVSFAQIDESFNESEKYLFLMKSEEYG